MSICFDFETPLNEKFYWGTYARAVANEAYIYLPGIMKYYETVSEHFKLLGTLGFFSLDPVRDEYLVEQLVKAINHEFLHVVLTIINEHKASILLDQIWFLDGLELEERNGWDVFWRKTEPYVNSHFLGNNEEVKKWQTE